MSKTCQAEQYGITTSRQTPTGKRTTGGGYRNTTRPKRKQAWRTATKTRPCK